MSAVKYRKGKFCDAGSTNCVANDLEPNSIVALSNCKYFYVDDVDKEFINDKVADSYGDYDDVLAKHTKITIYDELDNSISDIPGDTPCLIYVAKR